MTYLDWGCEPLAEECGSCLDAICRACVDEYKRQGGQTGVEGGYPDDADGDGMMEPDCEQCRPERKTGCATCGIILAVCRDCTRRETCECRIC